MNQAIELTRHFLATIAYRFQTAVRQAHPGFGEFLAGPGTRTPNEIVRHMTQVLMFARRELTDSEGPTFSPGGSFDKEVDRFYLTLKDLDRDVANSDANDARLMKRLLQGPLSDVMTHIGQLAMLSRLSGAPVPAEDFSKAKIDFLTGDTSHGSPSQHD